eukprot:COSAG05_NODE_409_length_10118_cov_457.524204_3_plen_156_part_00
MMASAPVCRGQSTDLQTRARAPAEGMPVDIPARQRAVRSTDLESCSSGLKSRGSKINRVLKFHHSFYMYKGIIVVLVLVYTGTAVVPAVPVPVQLYSCTGTGTSTGILLPHQLLYAVPATVPAVLQLYHIVPCTIIQYQLHVLYQLYQLHVPVLY